MLLWGEAAQGHIRAIIVAGPHPLGGEVLNFFNASFPTVTFGNKNKSIPNFAPFPERISDKVIFLLT